MQRALVVSVVSATQLLVFRPSKTDEVTAIRFGFDDVGGLASVVTIEVRALSSVPRAAADVSGGRVLVPSGVIVVTDANGGLLGDREIPIDRLSGSEKFIGVTIIEAGAIPISGFLGAVC